MSGAMDLHKKILENCGNAIVELPLGSDPPQQRCSCLRGQARSAGYLYFMLLLLRTLVLLGTRTSLGRPCTLLLLLQFLAPALSRLLLFSLLMFLLLLLLWRLLLLLLGF